MKALILKYAQESEQIQKRRRKQQAREKIKQLKFNDEEIQQDEEPLIIRPQFNADIRSKSSPALEGGSHTQYLSTHSSIPDDDDDSNWVELIPLIICILIIVALTIWCCADYKTATRVLGQMCDYVKDHPYESIGILIGIYILVVLTILPITPLHLMVAYAYCKVYDSFWLGFLMATAVIFLGCFLGAIVAILLARFLFANYIKRKLDRSKSVNVRKWRIVDGMFVTDGIFLVTLLRLMFLPYGLVCYLLGVTAVSLCDYILGTLVYIVKIALIVIVGCTVWQAQEEAQQHNQGETNSTEVVILVFEIGITIVITVWVTIWAKNKLQAKFEQVEKDEEIKRLHQAYQKIARYEAKQKQLDKQNIEDVKIE